MDCNTLSVNVCVVCPLLKLIAILFILYRGMELETDEYSTNEIKHNRWKFSVLSTSYTPLLDSNGMI